MRIIETLFNVINSGTCSAVLHCPSTRVNPINLWAADKKNRVIEVEIEMEIIITIIRQMQNWFNLIAQHAIKCVWMEWGCILVYIFGIYLHRLYVLHIFVCKFAKRCRCWSQAAGWRNRKHAERRKPNGCPDTPLLSSPAHRSSALPSPAL